MDELAEPPLHGMPNAAEVSRTVCREARDIGSCLDLAGDDTGVAWQAGVAVCVAIKEQRLPGSTSSPKGIQVCPSLDTLGCKIQAAKGRAGQPPSRFGATFVLWRTHLPQVHFSACWGCLKPRLGVGLLQIRLRANAIALEVTPSAVYTTSFSWSISGAISNANGWRSRPG